MAEPAKSQPSLAKSFTFVQLSFYCHSIFVREGRESFTWLPSPTFIEFHCLVSLGNTIGQLQRVTSRDWAIVSHKQLPKLRCFSLHPPLNPPSSNATDLSHNSLITLTLPSRASWTHRYSAASYESFLRIIDALHEPIIIDASRHHTLTRPHLRLTTSQWPKNSL